MCIRYIWWIRYKIRISDELDIPNELEIFDERDIKIVIGEWDELDVRYNWYIG